MDSYTVLIIIAAALLPPCIWYIATMNRFARMAVKIAEADSGIDVALTKRHDSLVKMRDVVKAYAKHEADTLSATVQLRAGMSMPERGEANRLMNDLAGRLTIVAEAYPELRSSENFLELQRAITEAEEHLQAARRIYNMNVSSFNQLLASWPASIVGAMNRHTPKDFFAADERKKEDVAMDF